MELAEKYFELGKAAGMSQADTYDLAHQFFVVYPTTWESLLVQRLKENRDVAAVKARLDEKRAKIRELEVQLQTKKAGVASVEKFLDKRIEDLQKQLGEE